VSPTTTLVAPRSPADTRRLGAANGPASWAARLPWGLIVRALVPLAALWVEGLPALVGALLVQEVGLWLAPRLASDGRLAARLYLLAFAVRAAVAIPLHVVRKGMGLADGSVFQDDGTYDLVAAWLVRIAHGDGIAIFPGHKHLLDSLYPYLIGGVYGALGYAPLVPKLLNAALAALGAVLVMEMGRRAFRPTVGALAGIGFALLPTLVLYGSVSLKEPLLLVALLVCLRALQELSPRSLPIRSPAFANAGLVLVAGLALVDDLRPPMVLVLVGLGGLALLRRVYGRLGSRRLALAGLLVAGVAAGGIVVIRVKMPDTSLADLTHPDYLALQLHHRRAWEATAARSQIGPQVDPYTPEGARVALPDDADSFSLTGDVLGPVAFALLSPAPWQARSLRDVAASGEMMMVWYLLLAAAFLARRSQPRQPWFVITLALYGLTTWLLLALTEGNLGNLLRHRMMLTPTVLILGSAGLVWLWPRLVALRVAQPSAFGPPVAD